MAQPVSKLFAVHPLAAKRKTRPIIALLLVLLVIALSFFLLAGNLTGLAAYPGFLGTRAGLFSDINLVAEFVLLVGLSLGVFFARKGHITAHQYIQTGMVFFNIALSLFIMVGSFVRNVIPGLPEGLRTAFGIVSVIHAGIGGLSVLCAVYLLLRMNQLIPKTWRISWWRNLMRLTFALYWSTGILGLFLYDIWYIR